MVDIISAPTLRPRACVGGLMDIPLGRYHKGKYGDNLLSGGSTLFNLTGGRGNTFKTALTLGQELTVLDRYENSDLLLYDAELTLGWDRIEDLVSFYPNIDFNNAVEDGRIILTSAGEYMGEGIWNVITEKSKERAKNFKRIAIESPFLDRKGNPIKMLSFSQFFIDSISQLDFTMIQDMHDKHDVDDGKAQTDNMRSSGIKSRMIQQIPYVAAKGGIYFAMTSHVGDEIKIDPYAPAKQLLAHVKKGLKFKNTPEKASFLSSVTWYISLAEVIAHSDKTPLYPALGLDKLVNDTDLQRLHIINARSKHGPAGHTVTQIISQTEGRKRSLSEWDYLKTRKDKFGLAGPEGISKEYRLDLLPDLLIKRKEVRDLCDNDLKLQRALEITSEMSQIYEYWVDFPRARMVSPKLMYSKLKEMGYDWDLLLTTRGYWTHDQYTNPVKPLSTMDLIEMYHGEYIPWWYPNKDKIKKV
jgi:hypothetical protein